LKQAFEPFVVMKTECPRCMGRGERSYGQHGAIVQCKTCKGIATGIVTAGCEQCSFTGRYCYAREATTQNTWRKLMKACPCAVRAQYDYWGITVPVAFRKKTQVAQ
jgi:hypothetical protein